LSLYTLYNKHAAAGFNFGRFLIFCELFSFDPTLCRSAIAFRPSGCILSQVPFGTGPGRTVHRSHHSTGTGSVFTNAFGYRTARLRPEYWGIGPFTNAPVSSAHFRDQLHVNRLPSNHNPTRAETPWPSKSKRQSRSSETIMPLAKIVTSRRF
jgi:hypothetical protein